MSKGTIKVKRKCCRSTPACKSCPIVVLREVLKDAKAKDARKAAKKARANGDPEAGGLDTVAPERPKDKKPKPKKKNKAPGGTNPDSGTAPKKRKKAG